jgi:hypothetical protein
MIFLRANSLSIEKGVFITYLVKTTSGGIKTGVASQAKN